MFSGLADAPIHAKVGVGFGLLLTAIPAALDVSIIVKIIVSPPTSAGTWVVLVLALLFIAAFGLAGLRATQLVARGNVLGCTIFVRPAYVMFSISLLNLVRAFTPYGGGVPSFLLGLLFAAFFLAVIAFYRWLASAMPAGGWAGTGARPVASAPAAVSADPLTRDEYQVLQQAVSRIPMVAADVVTGKSTAEDATRRVAGIAGGSPRLLAEAHRIFAKRAAEEQRAHVRAVAEETVRLIERARQQVLAAAPTGVEDPGPGQVRAS